MANNYTMWSETIELSPFDDERQKRKGWIKKVLTSYDDWSEDLPNGAEPSAEAFEEYLSKLGVVDIRRCNDLEYWPSFDWGFTGDCLWVYSEESGDIDNLSIFVQAYLKKFMPKAHFTMQWASTCSKPRVGEFHGGAMVVTADAVIVKPTWTVVEEILKELEIRKDDE